MACALRRMACALSRMACALSRMACVSHGTSGAGQVQQLPTLRRHDQQVAHILSLKHKVRRQPRARCVFPQRAYSQRLQATILPVPSPLSCGQP